MSSAAARAKAAPVLALFRKIMRAHREKLPPPVRAMGDRYVHDEFQRHLRGKTTEEQWRIFMAEWQHYHSMLSGVADLVGAATGGGSSAGGHGDVSAAAGGAGMTTTAAAATGSCGELAEDVLQAMTPDQRERLERLRLEAGRFGRELLSPEGDAGGSSSSSGGSAGSGDSRQAAADGQGSAPS